MSIAAFWNTYSAEARKASPHELSRQTQPLHGVVRSSSSSTRPRPERAQVANHSTSTSSEHLEHYHQAPLPYITRSAGRFPRARPNHETSIGMATQQLPTVPPNSAFSSLFDSTLEHFHRELTTLRDTCTEALLKEQRETQRWKARCDRARERAKFGLLVRERERNNSHNDTAYDQGTDDFGDHEYPPRSRSHSPVPSISKTSQRSSLRRRPSSSSSSSVSSLCGFPPSSPDAEDQQQDQQHPPLSSTSTISNSSLRRSWGGPSTVSPDSSPFLNTSDTLTSNNLARSPSPDPPLSFSSFPCASIGVYPHRDATFSQVEPQPQAQPQSQSHSQATLLKRSQSAGPILTPTSYCAARMANPTVFDSCDVHGDDGSDRQFTGLRHRQPYTLQRQRPVLRSTEELSQRLHEAQQQQQQQQQQQPQGTSLRREHLDILYTYENGEYHCQACLISRRKSESEKTASPQYPQFPNPPTESKTGVFHTRATACIDGLVEHYMREHPVEAGEVSRLGMREVRGACEWLRRMRRGGAGGGVGVGAGGGVFQQRGVYPRPRYGVSCRSTPAPTPGFFGLPASSASASVRC